MIAYKGLIIDDDGAYQSANYIPGEIVILSQEYKLQEENFPKFENSGIFCFESKERALEYFNMTSDRISVWEVEGEPLENPPTRRLSYMEDSSQVIKTFWENRPTAYQHDTVSIPHGTILLKSVKLIKRIK